MNVLAHRIKTLEEAKALSLAGNYREARELAELLLEGDPRDIDALRLKGNIIELEVLNREADRPARFVHSPEFAKARACYEQVLLLEPNHLGVLADLGTHWKSLGQYSKALKYFDRVISADGGKADPDEIVEALEGKIEILREQGDTGSVRTLEIRLRNITGQPD